MVFEQGVHDISNEDYHVSEGVSRSAIMEFKKTPFHYWNAYLNPDRPSREKNTEATIIGNAFHTIVLEPDKFKNRYVVKMPSAEKLEKVPLLRDVGRDVYDAAKKKHEEGKARQEQAEADFAFLSEGKIILSQDSYDVIVSMKKRLLENEQAAALIEGAQYEKSIFWTDPHTGLMCKCRPDIWHLNMIGDLKTAASAASRDFQRSLYNYGYHIQAGMINEGLRIVHGIDMRDFIYIAQEKDFPHAHAIYKLDELALEQGVVDFKNTLLKIKICYEKNEWPSYPTQIITLPAYATIGE
jgi:hypothetical protein